MRWGRRGFHGCGCAGQPGSRRRSGCCCRGGREGAGDAGWRMRMRNRLWITAALLTIAAAARGEPTSAQNTSPGPLIVFVLLPAGVCCFAALEVVLWVLAPAALS